MIRMDYSSQTYLQEVIVKKQGFFGQHYDFYLDGRQVASLVKKGFSGKALLTNGSRQYCIRLAGFWKGRLEFLDVQTSQVISAIPVGRSFKTAFTTESGKNYLFKKKSAWKGSFEWLDEYEQIVMELKFSHFSLKHSGRILLYQPLNNELQLLMLVGWYQLIVYQARVAAAAG